MQKFLIPSILILIFSLLSLVYLLYNVSPFSGTVPDVTVDVKNVVSFMMCVFFFVVSASSLLLYGIYRVIGDYQAPRFVYRKSLYQSLLVGLAVVIILVLLLTNTANVLTIILCVLFIVSLGTLLGK